MIGQDIWQRVFTARSPEIARWGTVAAGVYCLLYALAGALVGTAARVILPDIQADNAFARIATDRKSTRLNSSHANISYAVFCLKKKKKIYDPAIYQYLTQKHV